MFRVIGRRSVFEARTRDGAAASLRSRAARWPAAAAFVAGVIAWVSADLLALPREALVVPYVLAAALLTALFVHEARIDVIAAMRRNPGRALLATVVTSGLLVASVLTQPGAPRSHGAWLAFELAWDGLAYGVADGLLLTVVPMAAVRQSLGESRWTSDVLALFASLAVVLVYHFGFPEYRDAAIVGPILGGAAFGAAYLVSRNPLAPVVAHVVMHVAAVLHGPAGTTQLPPHY